MIQHLVPYYSGSMIGISTDLGIVPGMIYPLQNTSGFFRVN